MTDKPRNMGRWTEARFRSFITSQLRKATYKWPPKNEALRRAKIKRGVYRCNACKQEVPTSVKEKGKRKQNVFVDHINPVIDPKKGFTTWDTFIERLFCEIENFQVLCRKCHDEKTKGEREVANKRKKNEK
nr:hypothetical protein 3 [bacterium]